LKFTSFIAYAWTGGALWVTTFLTLGYYLGENWETIAELIHRYVVYASIALLIAVGGYYLVKKQLGKPAG